jgi:hypothetical protein
MKKHVKYWDCDAYEKLKRNHIIRKVIGNRAGENLNDIPISIKIGHKTQGIIDVIMQQQIRENWIS